ncbi:MAG: glycyl-radical enzyme activating protein [Ruminococcaceae bacterium]|jgi:pyruvate formate lyase activating enzyme|nr:glycyl-radical enzyme activating protein [Oscillospiraceae bacterium]
MNWYDDIKGRIFNIQRFSIHDGPGVRTIVFLKGCALRCRWCCNPESQSSEIETMITDGKAKTVGQDITVKEVMQEVVRDMPYYRRSGGGLTLSGGECLCQADFSAALLAAAKDMGINTAIESTACMEFEKIEKLLPYLDLYLMDIKHINSEKHKAFTKRDNKLILENAKKLAVSAKRLIIRVPVVPTFNDTVQEITDIARFAANLPNVKEIHLLPYHRLGQDKYEGLGREYTLKEITPPGKEHMEKLAEAARQTGLYVQIGG